METMPLPQKPPEIACRPTAAAKLIPAPRAMQVLVGLVALTLSVTVWQSIGLLHFSPKARQANVRLFSAVQTLTQELDQTAVVYIVTQNRSGGLLWRAIAYAMIPRRVLMLPAHWVSEDGLAPDEFSDPTSGSAELLGANVHFSGPAALAQYIGAHGVTHLVIVSGDDVAATAVGLPLREDRMHLIRFNPHTAEFIEVADVGVP